MRDPLLPVDPLTGQRLPDEPTPEQAAAEQRALDVCVHSSTPHTIRGRRVCPDCGVPR